MIKYGHTDEAGDMHGYKNYQVPSGNSNPPQKPLWFVTYKPTAAPTAVLA